MGGIPCALGSWHFIQIRLDGMGENKTLNLWDAQNVEDVESHLIVSSDVLFALSNVETFYLIFFFKSSQKVV